MGVRSDLSHCCDALARGTGLGKGTQSNVKPAVGFTLPSAGVTPAPSTNRKMARTPFCSQVLFWKGGSGVYLPVTFPIGALFSEPRAGPPAPLQFSGAGRRARGRLCTLVNRGFS